MGVEKYIHNILNCPRIPVPNVLAMGITFLQLLQMLVGCGVNILAWHYKGNGSGVLDNKLLVICVIISGRTCAVSTNNLCWCFLVASSQFILFAR